MATKKLLKKLSAMNPLDILGIKYPLVFVYKRWLIDGSPGTVNFPATTMSLDTALSDDRLLETLVHEVLEVIIDRFTIKLSHDAVCALEYGIIDTLRRNPILLKSLPGDSKGCQYKGKDFKVLDEIKTQEKKSKPRKNPAKKKA